MQFCGTSHINFIAMAQPQESGTEDISLFSNRVLNKEIGSHSS